MHACFSPAVLQVPCFFEMQSLWSLSHGGILHFSTFVAPPHSPLQVHLCPWPSVEQVPWVPQSSYLLHGGIVHSVPSHSPLHLHVWLPPVGVQVPWSPHSLWSQPVEWAQLAPLYPPAQVHVWDHPLRLPVMVQVPPCWQGVPEHGVIPQLGPLYPASHEHDPPSAEGWTQVPT